MMINFSSYTLLAWTDYCFVIVHRLLVRPVLRTRAGRAVTLIDTEYGGLITVPTYPRKATMYSVLLGTYLGGRYLL
jgi:hypothetical protein